jgi:ectoine hydroxylase-related dioxygenase (phytanoyl-CoA dioxygenase family)
MNTAKDICNELKVKGFFIAEELCSSKTMRNIREELSGLLEEAPFGKNLFVGEKTKRVHSLFAQTRALDKIATHPLVLEVMDRYLGDVLLGASVACQIDPGEKKQALHYDDGIYPLPTDFRDVKIGVMWAIDDFTDENGATIVVPKSQLQRSSPPKSSEHIHVQMKSGSALIYLGSLWHGAGRNQSSCSRLGVILQYVESWLRPQDSHLISVPIESARKLSADLSALLGYSMRKPFLGYVDGEDPRLLLKRPVLFEEKEK